MSKFKVVFVLGGPGSGKGTQSQLIQKAFNFKHLSAGQLLRQQQSRKESKYAQIIQNIIVQGKIVPSHITVNLLAQAIRRNQKQYKEFLIDGFPRNIENLQAWQKHTSSFVESPFVLHFQCSQKQMLRRLLKRGESSNRSDDNQKTILKRFDTYKTQTKQVLNEFARMGILRQVDADPSQKEVFEKVRKIFQEYKSNKPKL